MRLVRDMRAIRDTLAELRSKDSVEEEKASLELAESALRFSRNTKESVDNTLSFSATLMRAGEVQAATRLIAELEDDVHEEEVALVEAIHEVQAARTVRREKITRLRLARLLVTAMLGACVMGSSAMGIAVAGILAERSEAPQSARVLAQLSSAGSEQPARLPSGRQTAKRLQIGGTIVALNRQQLDVLRALKAGGGDAALLEAFLASLPPDVAVSVRTMIEFATAPIQGDIGEALDSAADGSEKATGDAAKTTEDGGAGKTTEPDPPDDGPTDDDDDDDDDGGLGLNTRGLPL